MAIAICGKDVWPCPVQHVKGNAMRGQVVGKRFEAAEHEAILPDRGIEERGYQTKHNAKGRAAIDGLLLRMEQRPVVGDATLAIDPVDNGTLLLSCVGSRSERPNARRVNGHGWISNPPRMTVLFTMSVGAMTLLSAGSNVRLSIPPRIGVPFVITRQ